MDFTKIEANYNETVYFDFATPATSFQYNLYCPFTPDYLIVRGNNYFPITADTPAMNIIYSDLVGKHIGSFQINILNGNGLSNFGIDKTQILYFKMNKPIQGTYTFSFFGQASSTTPVTLAGAIAIHLEFVKFKSEKPQVIM